MQETSQIICKLCRKVKTRFLDGRYPDPKNKKWIDEHGRQFNGRVCSECHKEVVRENAKAKRSKAASGSSSGN